MKTQMELTCICCPMGCQMQLEIEAGAISEVEGNKCKIGPKYARQEFADPRRMLSTTVACLGGLWPRLPVKTAEAIPKGLMCEIARSLHFLSVTSPVEIGAVIVENVCGTGINVVATRSMPKIKLNEDDI
jgi:CxxC motif-containing protein